MTPTDTPFDATRAEEMATWLETEWRALNVVAGTHPLARAADQLRAAVLLVADLRSQIENLEYETMGEDL